MTCDEFRTAFLIGATDERDPHPASCVACRAAVPDLEVRRELLTSPDLWEEPPAGLEDQIVTLAAGRRSEVRARPRSRWPLRIGGVAAAVAAFGAGFLLVAGRAPDWRIEAPGTDLAPEALAMVSGWNVDAGTRLVVEVEGLEDAPDGQVYEIWFSRGPIHISGGTFRTSGQIETTVGIARRDYPRIWITLEPEDEDASPSGLTVIDTG